LWNVFLCPPQLFYEVVVLFVLEAFVSVVLYTIAKNFLDGSWKPLRGKKNNKKAMKKLHLVIAIIILALVVRFGIIPLFSTSVGVSAKCIANPELNLLLQNIELVAVGTADGQNIVSTSKMIFTDTTMKGITIIKGNLNKSEIKARQAGGCDIITGFCVWVEDQKPFYEGDTYLLFLRQYPESPKDTYEGFSVCGGQYLLSSDPISQSAQIQKAREAINNLDEQKWQEFLKLLPYQYKTSGSVSPHEVQVNQTANPII